MMRTIVAAAAVLLCLGGCAESRTEVHPTATQKGAVDQGISGVFDQSTIQAGLDYMHEHRTVSKDRSPAIILRVFRGKHWSALMLLTNGHQQVWEADLDSTTANLLFDPGDYVLIAEKHGYGTATLDTKKTRVLHKKALDIA